MEILNFPSLEKGGRRDEGATLKRDKVVVVKIE